MTDTARPLHTRAARRAVIAPDLERYLDPANVDLTVTDQVQAVRVRVERGLEVFENRLRDARSAIGRAVAASGALVLGGSIAGYVALLKASSTAGGAATLGLLWALWVLGRAGLDLLRIHRISARFRRDDLRTLETSREVLDYGETVLAAARALGAIPHQD